MTSLLEFLRPLLTRGEVRLRERPGPAADRRAAADWLAGVYDAYRLDVAGPPLDFDAGAALAAAELLRQACWFLVRHDEPAAELDRRLVLAGEPASAAQHLSADLLLRYLPQVHRRARAVDPADRLAARLAEVLRRWPLSGVLSDVTEEPLTPPEFDGHPGLLLLYAERLARHDRPAWRPRGRGAEYVELVFGELGKPV
jgi:hypothetical protein